VKFSLKHTPPFSPPDLIYKDDILKRLSFSRVKRELWRSEKLEREPS
jgi:hypothetical protein